MNGLVCVQEWLGRRGESIAPEHIQFTTKPAQTCRGCLFDGQPSATCTRACQAAHRADLDHCERGFIYVAKDLDPRQTNLLDKEH
jgi:hypothetical protein